MRLSQLIGGRYKERPADAVLESHALLLRGGYVRQVANGIYSLLPPGLRAVRKVEQILREEMERVGAQESLLPVVLPRELWDESGRYAAVGAELARFEDRTGHGMVLAMTHEEAVVHLCRGELRSYAQLPCALFQIQTKFRDEPRSRGGLIRVREFTMKDAYSFHATQECLERTYAAFYEAYGRIFARAGLPEVVAVESDTGMMGGGAAHEFMLLCDAGEDTIIVCDGCGYRANLEVARGRVPAFPEAPQPLEKVHTPALKTIRDVAAYVGVTPRQGAKAVLYESDAEGRLVMLVIRGDLEASEAKVARLIGVKPVPASEARILECGAVPGFATAMGLDPAKCRVIVDHTIAESGNFVCGANEQDYHFKNFNLERDLPGTVTHDLIEVPEGALCPECGAVLAHRRGIEVGNIFQLGTKYTTTMNMTCTDESGASFNPLMGCYGIGVGRLVSAVIEARHDQFGPIWPMAIAPWHVHINVVKPSDAALRAAGESLYATLCAAGVETIYDDRAVSPGVQFADADLIGAPVRFIVGGRHLADGNLEFKRRDTGEKGVIPLAEAAATAREWIAAGLDGAAPAF